MPMALVGRKCGMTRVFTGDVSIPVTVIEVAPNVVTQVKTKEIDGYNAVQVTAGKQKVSRVNKPMKGHFAKAGVEPGFGLWEFKITEKEIEQLQNMQVGSELKVDLFSIGQKVDVVGISKGKGFAGTIKRHNFSSQRNSHGNSVSHRVPGSIGQNQTPGRVFKGKKMCGHLGNERVTIQGLEVVQIDEQRNVILLKGAVPGAPGGWVTIRPTVKSKTKSNAA